ncbi:MAG: hypothetical protein M3409_02945 [Gemmatimonadota bacterium]|jgi:chromate transport protein ChrA|nr:hypothetical protein [Gemmatimonadota bacterium]
MRNLLIAVTLITLPAVVVIVFALLMRETWFLLPAFVSFTFAVFPFAVAYWIYRSIGRTPDGDADPH